MTDMQSFFDAGHVSGPATRIGAACRGAAPHTAHDAAAQYRFDTAQHIAYTRTSEDGRYRMVAIPPVSNSREWACEELNLGPHAYQACALTT